MWCNYTDGLLILGKMMRNELLMKTLPGVVWGNYVLFPPPLHYSRSGRETRERRDMRQGRKRTNVQDFNKELSQQIAWPYINHAEAMGDLPTGPEHSHAPVGLRVTKSNFRARLCCPVQLRKTLNLCAYLVNRNYLNAT